MKLTFYGLYKQQDRVKNQDHRYSIILIEQNGEEIICDFSHLIPYQFRDKCRSMSKETAMLAYIDEIRNVNFLDPKRIVRS
jgi:hypothetical protein